MNGTTASPPTTPTGEKRTFFWIWFSLFTAVSMIVNGWHAGVKAPLHFASLNTNPNTHLLWESWKTAANQPPSWFTWGAVALGVLMPVALAFGSHALANPRPNISVARHRMNVALTSATVIGSFVLSFLAMQDMAMMMLGWSPLIAAIVPVAVDIAIVSALANLVAHSPRMTEHAVESRVSAHVQRLESSLTRAQEQMQNQFQESLGTVQNQLQEQFDTNLGTVQNQMQESLGMNLDALQERFEANLGTVRDELQEQLSASRVAVQERQEIRPALTRPSSGPVSVREPLTNTPETLTAALVAGGGLGTQTPEMIQRVLVAAADNLRLSSAKIAEQITGELPKSESVSKSTVHRILTAARDLDAQLDTDGNQELVA